MSQILALIGDEALESSVDRQAQSIEDALKALPADSFTVRGCPGARLGISRFGAGRAQQEQPLVDHDRCIALLYDGRIDNAASLRSQLEVGSDASESELLLSAYERWRDDLGRRLVGDFCCLFWDWRRRRYWAIRDQLGVRPLYYCQVRDGIYIGSDVDLIAAAAKLECVPDDRYVVEHLISERSSTDRTYWSMIGRLPGGRCLYGRPGESPRIEQYWKPAADPAISVDQVDVRGEFKRLFSQSVRRRLRSDRGVLSHLSGGLDSSLIVCMGAELSRVSRGDGHIVATLTERFPGKAWDEGEFVEAVTNWTGVPSVQWTTIDDGFPEVSHAVLSGPGMGVPRTSGTSQDLQIARDRGIPVLLCGEGGDQLGMPSGVADDRAAHTPATEAWVRLLRRGMSIRARLAEARQMIRRCAPMTVRRTAGGMRYRRSLPRWLKGEWHDMAADAFGAVQYPMGYGSNFRYRVQEAHWNDLTSGMMASALDLRQRAAGREGVELRFPFLDVDLVEFVLALGPNCWPSAGPGARLHRALLGDMVPPVVRTRTSKAIFSARIGERLRAGSQVIERLFSQGDWFSARYVDLSHARELLSRAASRPITEWRTYWAEWRDVRAIATLEAWLRVVCGYNAVPGDPRYA